MGLQELNLSYSLKLCVLREFTWLPFSTSVKCNDYSASLMMLFPWISKLITVNSSYWYITLTLNLNQFESTLANVNSVLSLILDLPLLAAAKKPSCPKGTLNFPTLAKLKLYQLSCHGPLLLFLFRNGWPLTSQAPDHRAGLLVVHTLRGLWSVLVSTTPSARVLA